MLMERERQALVEYGKRLLRERLTAGTAGNLSIREGDLMAISPSGIPYEQTRPEDIVIMTLDGRIVEGECKPSSEHGLHAAIYRARPQARAVVHTHSMYCTALACLHTPLKAFHYIIAQSGGSEVPLVPYCTYGTPELAAECERTLKEHPGVQAALLANHGLCACGASLQDAFSLAANCEWCAEVQWRCMAAGAPEPLTAEQIGEVITHLRGYGQQREESREAENRGYF